MARRQIRSNQHARRRQDEKRRHFRFYAVVGFLLVVLLIGITHWRAVQVQSIHIEAGEYAKPDLIQEMTESILDEPLWGVISRQNILLLPREEIFQKVSDTSSRIADVDIDIDGLRSITIKITDRQPIAEVCRQFSNKGPEGCHFIDRNGFVFSRADAATTTSQVSYITNSDLRTRTELLPAADFQSLQSFIRALRDISLQTNAVYIEEYGDVSIPVTDATHEAAGSVDLRVNIHDDLSQVLANLQTVIDNQSFVASTPRDGETPETISPFSLEYIDLRFENKVFYK